MNIRITPLTLVALLAATSAAAMPHNRRCDIAQDHPGNLNPKGGNAIMFGTCSGIEDAPTGESPSPIAVLERLQLRLPSVPARESLRGEPVL
jgi:hypothetical protein